MLIMKHAELMQSILLKRIYDMRCGDYYNNIPEKKGILKLIRKYLKKFLLKLSNKL